MSQAIHGVCVACHGDLSGSPAVAFEETGLYRCALCESWTCLPRPDAAALGALHDDPAYFAHPYFRDRRHNQRSLHRRCRNAFDRISAGTNVSTLWGERLLDIGCDTGSFLLAAKELYGMEPVGVDLSRRAVEVAVSRGIQAYATALETAPEHVPDPRALLLEMRSRLSPGGVLYLEVPNIGSTVYRLGAILFRLTAGRPRALSSRLFPPEHVQYFSAAGLRKLAESCRLEIVHVDMRVLPWSDIATSILVRVGVVGLQALDRVFGKRVLLCGVLRRAR
jgi:SAM-dependent methyltransferase